MGITNLSVIGFVAIWTNEIIYLGSVTKQNKNIVVLADCKHRGETVVLVLVAINMYKIYVPFRNFFGLKF